MLNTSTLVITVLVIDTLSVAVQIFAYFINLNVTNAATSVANAELFRWVFGLLFVNLAYVLVLTISCEGNNVCSFAGRAWFAL